MRSFLDQLIIQMRILSLFVCYKFYREQMIQPAATGTNHLSSKPTAKHYQKINGCTHAIPLWQVAAIAIMVVIQILNFDLVAPMLDLTSIPLYVLFAINCLFTILAAIDYVILLLGDPSDPRLADPSYTEPKQILVYCQHCESSVSQKSYHCHTCKRCVDDFDHHCVFLNNCIGRQNYSLFCRLLFSLLCHLSLNMGIGVAMCLMLDGVYKWVALSYALLSFLVFLQIGVLAAFHCYLSFCVYKSTLEVLRGERKKPSGEPTGNMRTLENRVKTGKEFKGEESGVKGGKEFQEQIVEEPTQMVIHKPHHTL